MRKLSLVMLATMLTACSSQPPKTLTKIDALHIPVVQNNPIASDPVATTMLHQKNKQIIDNVSFSLKTDYLLDVKTNDIFDVHSQTYRVYASLTKLDQMRLMNNYYLKEQNIAGLQKMNDSLQSLTQG
ncbi:MAG: hypothetical protein P0Y63_07590 [Klebsiella huaxiensis]|uniref:hypothetical protein n=1 Tax=Klebsiella TaxID=570 RepID=UPI0015F5086D|nr:MULTISPECIES: hypothetical protein [Klebsiella]MBA7933516.1 hypothetical protein [Klebsiella sp. RHBSTW-00215]WEJ90871.1 MAG: hypothetical protein P0Y63_07590 [Klebsiella huaxiensis]